MAYDKAIYKKLSDIVDPIVLQYLMASLVTASDAFMLGFLDQDSLSASSLAGQIAFAFSLFYGAFGFGLTVLAANTGARVINDYGDDRLTVISCTDDSEYQQVVVGILKNSNFTYP